MTAIAMNHDRAMLASHQLGAMAAPFASKWTRRPSLPRKFFACPSVSRPITIPLVASRAVPPDVAQRDRIAHFVKNRSGDMRNIHMTLALLREALRHGGGLLVRSRDLAMMALLAICVAASPMSFCPPVVELAEDADAEVANACEGEDRLLALAAAQRRRVARVRVIASFAVGELWRTSVTSCSRTGGAFSLACEHALRNGVGGPLRC